MSVSKSKQGSWKCQGVSTWEQPLNNTVGFGGQIPQRPCPSAGKLQGACSMLAFESPQWNSAPVAHSSGQLLDTHLLFVAFPSQIYFPTLLLVLSWITSEVDALHLHPCLRVCFWENPTTILSTPQQAGLRPVLPP